MLVDAVDGGHVRWVSVLVVVALVSGVAVPVVHVVDVVLVGDGLVPATLAVHVVVVRMGDVEQGRSS